MRTKFAVLAASLLAAVSAAVIPAGSAYAATGSCTGTLIYRHTVPSQTTNLPIAELVVYWNSSTGTNCAQFNHLGAAYGVAAKTWVTIYKCSQTTPTPQQDHCNTVLTSSTDGPALYKYYAGPVSVYSPHNCVIADGAMDWGGGLYSNNSSLIGC